jgi:hypothetical protein
MRAPACSADRGGAGSSGHRAGVSCVVHHSKNRPPMAEMDQTEPSSFVTATAELASIADASEAWRPSTVWPRHRSDRTTLESRRPGRRRSIPPRADIVAKVGEQQLRRNNRIATSKSLNQHCVLAADLGSMLLPQMPKIVLQQYRPGADTG